MSFIHDGRIRELCENNTGLINFRPMISPFINRAIRYDVEDNKIISYGLSSRGYDIRLSNRIKLFSNQKSAIVDPLNISNDCFIDIEGDYFIIPPNHYALGSSVEYFTMPRNMVALCLGKSTYARCGVIVNATPLEPEWEGNLVVEISNSTSLPIKVYANQGIAQILFDEGENCLTSYFDRGGKYQGQTGITLPLG